MENNVMENTDNITARGSVAKNILLTLLVVSTISTGYLAFDKVNENNQLRELLVEQRMHSDNNEKVFAAIEYNLYGLTANDEGVVRDDAKKEGVLSGVEQRIAREMVLLDKIMTRNREAIKKLTTVLGEKDQRIVKFKQAIAGLEKRINDYKSQKEEMIAQYQGLKMDLVEKSQDEAQLQQEVFVLQKEMMAMNEEIDSKAHMISWQSEELVKKDRKIRAGYYVVGTYKDLYDNKVVEKRGGIAGVGRTKTLKVDFDRNAFHQIDIYGYTNIPVFGADVHLLTNHATDSYELSKDPGGNVQWIKIIDPEKFWENSKYLVVEVKGKMPVAQVTSTEPELY